MKERKGEENEKEYETLPTDEFWSEHRTTLISYEAQFVFATKIDKPEQAERPKGKKKNIQYEGGFLFPGKQGDKEESIPQLIESSKYNNLKELFQETPNTPKETLKLRKFVCIMLQLKHSCILRQFLELYELIIKQIRDVKFESIRVEADRFEVVDNIANKVAGFVQTCPYLFTYFSKYLKENRKETTKLFKVSAYCFLAQKFNFNINEYYAEAFDFQEETNVPKKKKKLEEH